MLVRGHFRESSGRWVKLGIGRVVVYGVKGVWGLSVARRVRSGIVIIRRCGWPEHWKTGRLGCSA